jgi:hypothetical protein
MSVFSWLNVEDAQRFERAQRIARNDPAGAVARGEFLFRAEKIARPQAPLEQGVALLGDDARGPGRGTAAGKAARFGHAIEQQMHAHAESR